MGGVTSPSERIVEPPKRPWLLSTRPIPAIRLQLILQDGSVRANEVAAFTYARYAGSGIPDAVNPAGLVNPYGLAARALVPRDPGGTEGRVVVGSVGVGSARGRACA